MRRLCWLGVFSAICLLVAGGALAQSRTFTTDDDFDEGTLSSVHHDVADQLQLSEFSETKPFIYIANHRYGTVSKIDTNTGKEVARYPVCLNNVGNTNLCAPTDYYMKPHAYCDWASRGHCPSRTAVDLNGDVWVANRAFGQWASVTKIAGEVGHCVDRNGNGLIETSTDFSNNGKIDVTENETMAPNSEWRGQGDECVLFTVKLGTQKNELARALTIDANNNAWVGMFNTMKAYKVSNDGTVLGSYYIGANMYGLATDGLGYIYNSDLNYGIIKQINAATGAVVKSIDTPYQTYGIAAESDTQVVWLARWGGNGASLIKVDFKPATPTYTAYTPSFWSSGGQTRGVAIDADGNVWVSYWSANRLAKFNPTTGAWSGNYTVASGPIGVGIDSNNRIWTANYNAYNATRLDPVTGTTMNSVTIGVEPYSYSDMTGFQLTQGVVTQGTWTVTHDGGTPGIEWGTFTWNEFDGDCPTAGCIPPGTEIKVEVRASDTYPVSTTWTLVENGTAYTGIYGQYLEARITLRIIGAGGVSPVLKDFTVKPANQPPVCNAGSQVNVACNGGTSTVSLSGAASYDPEGQPLTFTWTAGTCAALIPEFGTANAAGTSATVTTAGYCSFGCQFQLAVSDGNSTTTCGQQLQMSDAAPVLSGVQGALVECNNGQGGVAATDPQLAAFFADPSAYDACTDSNPAVTNDAPAVFPYVGGAGFGITVAGTNVTFSATDNCEHTVSQIATVTVQDTAGPVAGTCPTDDTLVLDELSCQATATYAASATDACTGEATDSHTYSFAGPGSSSYTYSFADGNGNSSSCAVQTVTAVDEAAPAALSCPAGAELILDASCQASATYTASATDACTGFLSESYTFSFSAPGTGTYTYVLADGSGNEVTCIQTVSAVDKLAPAGLSCPADDLLYLDGACFATASYAATATDNCSGLLTDENSFSFNWPGTQSQDYLLADGSGNAVGCSQTVQAVDAMAPAGLSCPADDVLFLDQFCLASGTYTATATDNCSGALAESFTFPFHAPGATGHEYVLADEFGNAVSCYQTVQALDAIAPAAFCNNPATMLPRDAPATFTATGTDNCGAVTVQINSYNCTAVNGAGKVISKLGSCVVTINGSSLTVVDSGGVGDHITWTGTVIDGSGNVTPFSCVIDVVNPGNGGQGCNQGVGNGAEGCDPGNSNQGNPANSNDEKGGVPGNPGKSNSKKK